MINCCLPKDDSLITFVANGNILLNKISLFSNAKLFLTSGNSGWSLWHKSHTVKNHHNEVDGKSVPVPHFGVVLPWNQFKVFSQRIMDKGIEFIIDPYIRFKGLPGEQMTMFFYDPSGNALEFKSFKNISQLFEKWKF